ncbi:MAG: flavodoxin [Bacteroidota bacterium]|nr:flavodoxin [Bacteroidota bacterium]
MKTLILIIFSILTTSIGMQSQTKSATKKILVVYFSHSGNTRVIAEQIKNATGGDIFEIQPVKDYPSDYNAVVDQAKKEITANYKPALKTRVKNIELYDVIFVGSPNWWSTIAPPVATFLSGYNLEGKTIIPFITHEGSRMGHSVSDIKKLCPKSNVLEGLPIRGSNVKSAKPDVEKWLKEIKMKK